MKTMTKTSYPAFALFALGLTFSLALSPIARAVDPPPDGGYPGSNTAEGEDALFSLTSGFSDTAVGFNALYSNTMGFRNTALGFYALRANTTGNDNVAVGVSALSRNTTGSTNTAIGYVAMINMVSGSQNTASGYSALPSSRDGNSNTASGWSAMYQTKSGSQNTASGANVMFVNTTGSQNAAFGYNALSSNTTGSSNIAIGNLAGMNLTKGNNNIDLGNAGVAGESNVIRIGTQGTQQAAYVAGISGVTVADGVGVVIDTNGQLGTMTSSARYKEKIEPMGEASDKLLSLQPVKFRYRKNLDPKGIPQFGLVAEEVAKIDPDLVARDDEGKPYSVRYEAVNAMLLNEFLKEHRKVTEQGSEIAELRATVAELKSTLKEQAAQLRKVSAQVATGQSSEWLVSTGD